MIYDVSDNPMTAREIDLSPGIPYLFSMKADCRAGTHLRSSGSMNVSVEGRISGETAYVNLITTGLNVNAFAGQRKTFDIRVMASGTDFSLENLIVSVKP